jgi:hypothetical protein
VKAVIVFRDGRRVNLAGGVNADLYAELEGTQGRGSRKGPLLSCGGCDGAVYVKHGRAHRDELFGAHFDAGTCAEELAIRKSAMSDEHRRMQEYTVRAANNGGFSADTEVATSARTRVDVVVDGRIGVEVQLSGLTAGAAVRRTARSLGSGLELVAWCAERTGARWTGKVPGYQWLDIDQVLREMPGPRSVRARGVFTIRAERWGGRRTPVLEPLTLLVDEAVVRMAARDIRPVMWRGNVQLMRADGIALFEEMVGRSIAPYTGRAPDATTGPAAEALCLRPRVSARGRAMADEDFWCDTCGSQHPLREHRNCRARAATR